MLSIYDTDYFGRHLCRCGVLLCSVSAQIKGQYLRICYEYDPNYPDLRVALRQEAEGWVSGIIKQKLP